MSHYFKRESDYLRQGNGDGSSSHTVVPIFNTKKRRIKQALYSNPSSSQDTKSSFSNATSLNSGFQSNFTANASHETKGTKAFSRKPSPQSKNNSANTHQRPTQTKLSDVKKQGSGPKTLPCLPKPRPQYGVGGTPLKNGKQEPLKSEATVNMAFTAQPKNETPQLHKREHKTLGNSAVEKSSKLFTATIKTVMDWEEFRDKLTVVFEVYGVVESAVSTNSLGNGKSFMLKDNTGNIRCTFWEMDRLLPRMTRGRTYRVVGSLDRKTKSFNCVSVRPANPVEVRLANASTACSEMAMQSFITTFKED